MGYQSELNAAIDKMNIEELKIALYEVCLIANRGTEEGKKTIEQDILKVIDDNVLSKNS